MDEARIAGTDEIFDATQINDSAEFEGVDWRCVGCHAEVHPSALPTNGPRKVPAHFKRYRGASHDIGCWYFGLTKSGARSWRRSRIGEPNGWINKITFPEGRSPREWTGRRELAHVPVVQNLTRQSLTGACRFHYANEGKRWNWELQVTGVSGTTYYDCFEVFPRMPSAPSTRIWFGSMFVTAPVIERDGEIAFTVVGGVTVIADTRRWRVDHRPRLLAALKEAGRTPFRQDSAMPQVYVLATRSPDESDTVRFDDPRKFALIIPPASARRQRR